MCARIKRCVFPARGGPRRQRGSRITAVDQKDGGDTMCNVLDTRAELHSGIAYDVTLAVAQSPFMAHFL